MYSHKPIFISKYLTWKKTIPEGHIKHLFYLSWEDALWHILPNLGINKGSVILTPNWYCRDVEDNIVKHGYRIQHYSVNNNLQPNLNSIITATKKYKPKVLILLHPLGITNQLIANQKILKLLSKDHLVIEDSVHRIINPSSIKIISSNHLIIDSLRKTVPLQGSNVYGLKSTLTFSEPPLKQTWCYRLKVTALWYWMNIWWTIATLLRSQKAAMSAQKIMQRGYDLIGDSELPARGSKIFRYTLSHLNFDKIKHIKNLQISIYEQYFKSNYLTNVKPLKFNKRDSSELMGYPLKVNIAVADKLLKNIKENGLILRYELQDNNWQEPWQILCLPTGPYLKTNDIKKIAEIVIGSINSLATPAPHARSARLPT